MKQILHKLPGSDWLRGGWPDEARFIIQSAALMAILSDHPFTGECLNAGCGEGLYAPFLESFAKVTRIVHMDLAQPSVAQRLKSGLHEDCAGSLTDIPFASRTFNACLCSEVIEHVADDRRAFAELARVLRPGALLLITTPIPPAPPDPDHVREGYTLLEMTSQLEEAGFEVLRHGYCFHAVMRGLMSFWRWQFGVFGGGRRSWLPRAAIRAAGYADRAFPFGQPWDLLVLARRTS